MTLDCVDQVSSLIPHIRAISLGGAAHKYTCGERLWERASQAVDSWRHESAGPGTVAGRYGRFMHTSGLVVAAGLRTAVRPVFMLLDLFIGTGRYRDAGPERLAGGSHVAYVEGLINHPLDTGLLGLVSAYHAARTAMFAGTAGAVCGVLIGLALWPFRGLAHGTPIAPFADMWMRRGALFAGAFGALMGSCFIWSPYNFIGVQCLRVITAATELLVTVSGYAVGAVLVGLTCLLAHDVMVGSAHAITCLVSRWGRHGCYAGAL